MEQDLVIRINKMDGSRDISYRMGDRTIVSSRIIPKQEAQSLFDLPN